MFFKFFFLPQPAEYGAEEFSLNAVPTLGSVRIGLGGGGGCESTFATRINPGVHANSVLF